jgi:hypothetical protein
MVVTVHEGYRLGSHWSEQNDSTGVQKLDYSKRKSLQLILAQCVHHKRVYKGHMYLLCTVVQYIATTQPTTQKNSKQHLLGWYYNR